MTPAERARLIDRQEFEADCAAARRRAYEHLAALAANKDDRVSDWLKKPYEPGTFICGAPAKSTNRPSDDGIHDRSARYDSRR